LEEPFLDHEFPYEKDEVNWEEDNEIQMLLNQKKLPVNLWRPGQKGWKFGDNVV